MFREERTVHMFEWKNLGDIDEGRPNLGRLTSVAVYRLMQYTMRDILIQRFGVSQTDEILYEAGKLAGTEFCKNMLDTGLDLNSFISNLKEKLISLSVGILRVEKMDTENMEFILTVSEDLDCSGLPVSGETVCNYDEGFIAGILYAYTGKEFQVKEIDCWATGERTCRFRAVVRQ
jgi:predicted hydrocarbon binding protein